MLILYNSNCGGNKTQLTFIKYFLCSRHGKHFVFIISSKGERGEKKKKIKVINNMNLEKKSLLYNVPYYPPPKAL